MHAASEMMLYRCLWLAEKMMRPTVRVALSSFEDWAAREGFWRDIRRLEAEKWIEVPEGEGHRLDRVIRLTELGRKLALGGVLPPELWNRGWDGRWRLVIFDVPENARTNRARLRKWLKAARFGALQKSVWITPDPLEKLSEHVRKEVADCGVLTGFEGHPCLGEPAALIVKNSWDFAAVEKTYSQWQLHAEGLEKLENAPRPGELMVWGNLERGLWAECLALDPLLPRELWPDGYSGENCWNLRLELLTQAGRALGESSG